MTLSCWVVGTINYASKKTVWSMGINVCWRSTTFNGFHGLMRSCPLQSGPEFVMKLLKWIFF